MIGKTYCTKSIVKCIKLEEKEEEKEDNDYDYDDGVEEPNAKDQNTINKNHLPSS